MKTLLLLLALGAVPLQAQTAPAAAHQAAPAPDPQLEGIWEGYDGEWGHVSRQLMSLAEAIPADKYSWRPAKGVRSVSEVLMHIAIANFYLLSVTGPKMPSDITSDEIEETVTSKAEVIGYLDRSLKAVQAARAGMGFAVFADEVRNVAQRSAQTARDTAVLIEETIVQCGAGSVGAAAELACKITDRAMRGNALVDEVDGAPRTSRGA